MIEKRYVSGRAFNEANNEKAKAVAGWNQSIGILKGVSDGLRFLVDEINANKTAFSPDRDKAERFAKAAGALRTAEMYLRAHEQNGSD